MRRSTRRLLLLLTAIPSLLFLFAAIYQQGMSHLEGQHRSFGQAIEFVAESLTTTGYGADSAWHSPWMQAFVVVVQFVGLGITILIFPVFVVPFIEERFEARLPQALPDVTGAIVVYGWGPAVSPLVERMEQHDVPVVILEENLATARRLHDRGHTVVHTQLDDEDLDFSQIASARGIVAAGADSANAVLTMTVRHSGFTGTIVALVESPTRRHAMQRVGATAVFTPGHVLAAAVAARASEKISPRVSGAQSIGKHLQIAEVRIDRASVLLDKTLVEANLRGRTGSTIVGWWRDGELQPPSKAEKLTAGTILVAAGTDASIERLGKLATPVARRGAVIVIGHDDVARKVGEFLELAEEEVRRLSPTTLGDALVGDPLDPTILERSGVREARAVIVALDSDAETLFTTALVRDLAPEATIVAAARRAENVGRIRRAGADFALSVGQVAAQLLAFQLLGEEMVALEAEIRLVRTAAGEIADKQLAAARIGERTGCSVVAIERDEEMITELGADVVVRAGDALYITGSGTCIDRFYATFPRARAEARDS